MVSSEQLRRIMPQAGRKADVYAGPLCDAMRRFSIVEPMHVAAFVAQVAHESAQLNAAVENLNYRADRLLAVFPKYFQTEKEANAYARKPQAIASRVYAGRMGNGDEASGDGWKYRGRGLIQITGRRMYVLCGAGLDLPLDDQPELLELPQHAAASAAWYWWNNNLNALANDNDVKNETKVINGGTHGLAERQRFYRAAMSVLDSEG